MRIVLPRSPTHFLLSICNENFDWCISKGIYESFGNPTQQIFYGVLTDLLSYKNNSLHEVSFSL